MNDCWNTVGVFGDGSCPRLPEQGTCLSCSEYEAKARELFSGLPAPEYLARWAEVLSAQKEEGEETGPGWVVFRVSDERMALPASRVSRVVEPAPMHRVPGRLSGPLLGLANVEGELTPTLSLVRLANLEEGEGVAESRPRLLLLETGDGPLAFPVDGVEGVIQPRERDLSPPPATLAPGLKDLVRSMVSVEAGPVALLDADALALAAVEAIQ